MTSVGPQIAAALRLCISPPTTPANAWSISPQGHWYITKMVGLIRLNGVAAGLMFDGATDTMAFATFVELSSVANHVKDPRRCHFP